MAVRSGIDGIPTVHATPPGRRVPTRRPWKQAGANVKSQYGTTLQIGFVLALSILLGLTALRFETDDTFEVALSEQDVVVMEEVAQTEQEIKAPPPPRPAAPVEVANDVVLEQETLDFDATLDLNESLDLSGPPEPPAPEPNEEEETYEEEIFVVVEDQPELIGGLAELQKEIKYPNLAQKAGIEGRVFVQFVVNENGDVVNPTVIRGRHPLLDAEALRVIRLAKFEPGRQRGKAVKVQLAMPVTFKLKDKK
ncbi:energy transducer TonB [Longibacter salinarum]|uniref:Energy transducer TonB n=1 Tax=Longibacter salinarum TaxID=1850348 RepID=A0A2A8CYL2_9BACT|nr:energy transducer TonB [Longibacter salinarum]